jgi:hypothetical protein
MGRLTTVISVASLLLALGARMLLPTEKGLTFYLRNSTRYVPFNVFAFWLLLAASILVFAFGRFRFLE